MSSAIHLSERELRRFLQQEADLINRSLHRDEVPNAEFLRVHALAMLPWIDLLEATERSGRTAAAA